MSGSSCQIHGFLVVHLIRCLVIKALVESSLIVVLEVPFEHLPQMASTPESGEVDALVFDAAPEPFHEDVVMVATLCHPC